MVSTEGTTTTETKLKRISELSATDSEVVFTHVIHHINTESLRACFHELDGRKAIGIDGIDKEKYGVNLDKNLQKLIVQMKRMAYIPGPVRQVLIPKEDKVGATRPLGISNFEDKLIQRMMHKILESIYEPLFHKDSYGFRPGRSCHDAIKELYRHLFSRQVETVIDVDLSNYFGSIPQEIVLRIIEKKIGDPRIIRYLKRMFKSGLLIDGELVVSDEGVVQGSACSPIIANIFAHEVIDVWVETMVKPHCKGEVKMVRYADDIVICCQYNRDAERIKTALTHRLAKYGLKLNENKTKLVRFSKIESRRAKQETFDFLGFTFYYGKSRSGYYIVKVKTVGKRFSKKLKNVNIWAKSVKNKASLQQIIKIAAAKVRGHIQYYGVSFNFKTVDKFVFKVCMILFRWLNRRSQRKSFTWDQFKKYLDMIEFPKARVCHTLILTNSK